MMANHPFAKRQLNPLDENGQEGCAICGRPRGFHRQSEDWAEAGRLRKRLAARGSGAALGGEDG